MRKRDLTNKKDNDEDKYKYKDDDNDNDFSWPNIHNFGQFSQSQPNFTILEYLEYLELGQFRNFCDVLL